MIEARGGIDLDKINEIEDAGWTVILRMAARLQKHLMEKLNIPNTGVRVKRIGRRGSYTIYPNSSKPGEYLRARTGYLQAHIVVEPTSPTAAAIQGSVRIGYGKSAFYGAIWELKPLAKKRKGLLDALEEIRGELMAMMPRKT